VGDKKNVFITHPFKWNPCGIEMWTKYIVTISFCWTWICYIEL